MAHRTIDLNADVGEATDAAGMEVERALLAVVTSAHVACGGHAGDEESMAATVAAAARHTRSASARIPRIPTAPASVVSPWTMDRVALRDSLSTQLADLDRVCRAAGTSIESVKPHGALYGEVAKGGAIYETFRDAVRGCFGDRVPLGVAVGLPRHGDGPT